MIDDQIWLMIKYDWWSNMIDAQMWLMLKYVMLKYDWSPYKEGYD